MERNELLDKFFELKCKQMLCKLWLMAFAKPGYVGAEEFYLMQRHMKVQANLEDVEDKMLKLLSENKEFFMNADLDGYCKEYKISLERQRELAKEVLDKEWTIEELMEKVEKR